MTERDHASVVKYMDAHIGELLALLKDLKIDEETIVFFASDNGASNEGRHSYEFFNSSGGLKGFKRSKNEGGVRSPSMVRWPGTIQPAKSSFQWAFWDMLPTFADLAGAAVPEGLDGVSIVPTLLGQTQDPKPYIYHTWTQDRNLAAELPVDWVSRQNYQGLLEYVNTETGEVSSTHPLEENNDPANKQLGFGIRIGDWKGIVQNCGDSNAPSKDDVYQIFDLSVDPFETNDIASTAEGQSRRSQFIDLILQQNVSCNCFQC